MSADSEKLLEIRKMLWANRESAVHEGFVAMLEIKLRQGKDKLVEDCTPENFPIVQGQAKAYAELLTLLRKEVVDIRKG